MRKIYELDKHDVVPTSLEVLAWQKMPERSVPPRIARLIDEAIGVFHDTAQPLRLMEDFDMGGFPELYKGRGNNAQDGPIPGIVARANASALMAVTMGEAPAIKCREFLEQGKASLGYMLNVVGAAGADRMGGKMCRIFLEHLQASSENSETKDIRVQYYSPGHCGWHISGQEKLFDALHPDEIGISIDAHCIMHPFKSLSGILAAGPMEIHRFHQSFSFCPQCRERKCVERIKQLA